MSAIGSYAVLRRSAFPRCLDRARQIRTETTGRWVFTKTTIVGQKEFESAWADALVEEVPFDYSGYILGIYLDAQHDINQVPDREQASEPAHALAKAFTAAFPFEQRESFSSLPEPQLTAWCRKEAGDAEAPGMVEAIAAAHAFYERGLARIDDAHVVVFVIR